MAESIRVIALIDMDAFYTQVEEREQPHFRGRPLAVVPFNRGPTISGQAIAVNYPARAFGIKRGMDCNEMRRLCPIIQLCRVPSIEGVEKGDITKYRDASGEIFKVLVEFSDDIVVEKASVDEAFLDLTKECEKELESHSMDEWVEKLTSDVSELFPSTFLVDENDKQQTLLTDERLNCLKKWLDSNCRLSRQQLAIAIGSTIVERIRKRVKEVTQFSCSAGISHNKILAKLVCARHKPACQSVIVPQNIPKLYEQTPISSVRNLGGKFGKRLMRHFNAEMLAQLQEIPREVLLKQFHPKNVDWLTQLLKGENYEPICSNLQPKSLGTSKNFAGANMLTTISSVKKWLQALSNELSRRLIADDDKYGRVAQTLVIGFSTAVGEHNVRTLHLPNYTSAAILQTCWNYMKPFNREKDGHSWYPHVSCIYMSASRFETVGRPTRRITEFFRKETADGDEDKACCCCVGSDDEDEIIFLDERNLRKNCADNEAMARVNEEGNADQIVNDAGIDDEIVILEEKNSTKNNSNGTTPANIRTKIGRKRGKNGVNIGTLHHHRRRLLTRRITEFFHQDFACVIESSVDCCGSDDAEIVILENRNPCGKGITMMDRRLLRSTQPNFTEENDENTDHNNLI